MASTPVAGGTARTVEAEFVELICNEEDLLKAEFDAIIAAHWPDPPADRPGRGAGGGQPIGRAPRRRAAYVAWPVDQPPGIGGRSRQRSPPPTTTTTEHTKGR